MIFMLVLEKYVLLIFQRFTCKNDSFQQPGSKESNYFGIPLQALIHSTVTKWVQCEHDAFSATFLTLCLALIRSSCKMMMYSAVVVRPYYTLLLKMFWLRGNKFSGFTC